MTLSCGQMGTIVQHPLPGRRSTRPRNPAQLARGVAQVRDGRLTLSEVTRYPPGHSARCQALKRMARCLANSEWHHALTGPVRCASRHAASAPGPPGAQGPIRRNAWS